MTSALVGDGVASVAGAVQAEAVDLERDASRILSETMRYPCMQSHHTEYSKVTDTRQTHLKLVIVKCTTAIHAHYSFSYSRLAGYITNRKVEHNCFHQNYSATSVFRCPSLRALSNSFLTGTLPCSPCATWTGLGARFGGRIPAPCPATGVLDIIEGRGC